MIRFSRAGLIGLGVLATTMGMPGAIAAQDRAAAPPPRSERAQRETGEADDIALLLALRPEQRPALAAFVQSMGPPPRGAGFMRGDHGPQADDSAPPADGFARHLDRMTQDLARRSAEDARRIAVARTFYDGLDPTQRHAFEALMRLRVGAGPHGPGPHRPDGDYGPPPPSGMPPRR